MGNIKSFCCKEGISDDEQNDESAQILNDDGHQRSWDDLYSGSSNNSATSQHHDSPLYGSININGADKIEQTALNKIIQRMTSNVIDVAPGEPLVLQQIEINERQRTYQSKLNQVKGQLLLKSSRMPRYNYANAASSSTDTAQQQHQNPNQTLNTTASTNTTATTNNTTTTSASGSGNNSSLMQQTSNSPQHAKYQYNSNMSQSSSKNPPRVDYEPMSSDDIRLITDIGQKSAIAIKEGGMLEFGDQVVVPMSDVI